MNNNAALLRNLIIYAICVPVAIIVGYWAISAASMPGRTNLILMGCVALALTIPIFLRWHHPMMVLCWNLPIIIFFLQGSPGIGLPLIGISLGISLLQRATNRNMHFLRAPQLVLPLCVLIGVALITAHFSGGIGLHSLGSEIGGGKRYIGLFLGLFGYFALTARRIPPEKAGLYAALFFLPPCIGIIGDLVNVIPAPFTLIYYVIPANGYANLGRFPGTAQAATAIFTFMLVHYGVRGIFLTGKPWRIMVLILAFVGISLGGFRSQIILAVSAFTIQFFIEGLHRSKLLPVFIFIGIFAVIICVPFANKLPIPAQRALAWLPLNIDSGVKMDAQGSMDWRLDMWKALLPQVPQHLWLGKGYAISAEDWMVVGQIINYHNMDPAEQGLALAGNYHNGPLSVILPLGIWGCLALLWIFIAGIWALQRNYRYGDPRLKIINVALFALFVAKILSFLFIFGDLPTDMVIFAGYLGLSVALNGGICRKTAPASAAEPPSHPRPFRSPRFQPAFQK